MFLWYIYCFSFLFNFLIFFLYPLKDSNFHAFEAPASKTGVSTIPPKGHINFVAIAGFEPERGLMRPTCYHYTTSQCIKTLRLYVWTLMLLLGLFWFPAYPLSFGKYTNNTGYLSEPLFKLLDWTTLSLINLFKSADLIHPCGITNLWRKSLLACDL